MSIENKIKNFLNKLTDEEIQDLKSGQVLSFELNNTYYTFAGSLTDEEDYEDEDEYGLSVMTDEDVKRLREIDKQINQFEFKTFEGTLFGPIRLISKINIYFEAYSDLTYSVEQIGSQLEVVSGYDCYDSNFDNATVKAFLLNYLGDLDLCGDELEVVETLPEYIEFMEALDELCKEFNSICKFYEQEAETVWNEL